MNTPRVSMFADAYSGTPHDCTLAAVVEAIRSDKYQERIRRARKLFAAWKAVCPALDSKLSPEAEAYDDFKKTLPAFCVSGTAASRTEPLQHSNLIQVDMDKLNGTLETVREKVKADPCVAFGFVSPSGDGLKLGVLVDGTRHLESFFAAEKYFLDHYGIKVDPKVKDPLRLCFVSHDPQAWLANATAALVPESQSAPTFLQKFQKSAHERKSDFSAISHETPDVFSASASPEIIVLPSGAVSISESARVIFLRLAPMQTLFWRGGALVELVTVAGVESLEILKPDKFRSDCEKLGQLRAWRVGRGGVAVLAPAKMSLDDSKAIMATSEARGFLPSVASVLRCPVLIETKSGDVAILGRGYHEELGGLLIVAGDTPPQVALAEAVASLRWLVEEFLFQDEGDRSRALAAFITPALRLGGFIRGNIPIAAIEADLSQSGKGYLLELIVMAYNELSYFVAQRAGGVGSFDESLSAAFISGRPFPNLDNLRGHIASAYLESFVTCPGLFPARVPHRGEVLIDPRRFILQMTSNGLETTRDLAARASICRIRKRPGFQYRDTLGELQSRQPFFLGCVFAVIAEWISNGKPRTNDTRHDFREWSQALDWIVQNILRCAPLLDGHEAAQERTSNPVLSWLRAVALAVAADNRLGVALIASEIVELCELHAIEFPGKPADEDRAKRQVGSLCKQLFRDGDTVEVDGFTVTRAIRYQQRDGGGAVDLKTYTFSKP